MDEKIAALKSLEEVVERLCGPNGCPWDREQTLGSLTPNFLEESCEIADAVESCAEAARPKDAAICEELGDLLMNILLAARVAEESGGFSIADVARTITEKLIHRHPHVFGDAAVKDADEVLARWKALKAAERRRSGKETASVLDRVPRALPPLEAAFQLGRRAAEKGFDWPDPAGALEKVREETHEVERALSSDSPARLEHEIGDLLLAVVNLSRKAGIPPDRALRRANQRFRTRFARVEAFADAAVAAGRTPTLEELEEKWQQAKRRDEGR